MLGLTTWAFQLRGASPHAKLAAICISECPYGYSEENTAQCSLAWLMDWTGLTEAEALSAIKELENLGVRKVMQRGGDTLFIFPLKRMEHRPEEKPKNKLKIYVISGGGLSKIGISMKPLRRVRDLQNANPHEILSLDFYTGDDEDNIIEVERAAHNSLIGHHVGNEWFSVPKERAIEAVMLALASVRGGAA